MELPCVCSFSSMRANAKPADRGPSKKDPDFFEASGVLGRQRPRHGTAGRLNADVLT